MTPPSGEKIFSCKDQTGQAYCNDPFCGNRDSSGLHWADGRPKKIQLPPRGEKMTAYAMSKKYHADCQHMAIGICRECLEKALQQVMDQARKEGFEQARDMGSNLLVRDEYRELRTWPILCEFANQIRALQPPREG